jgi:succinoglycan biosynthesis protein ExoA
MPTRNEHRTIEAALRTVLQQDYPSDRCEVIIADGMSDDGTREVIEALIDIAGPDAPHVTLIANSSRTAPAGLNAALDRAKGDVIVRIDGHCEVQPDYLSRCVHLLDTTGAANVGGTPIGSGDGVRQRAFARATRSPFGVGNARFRYASRGGWVDTVYLGAWRREVFELVGRFDEELVRNQDDEHNFRIVQTGGRIWFDPELRTRCEVRKDFRSLWRQYFDYGFYKVRVIQKRRGVASWRQIVPALFVVALVSTVVIGSATRRPKVFLVLVAPYSALNALAALQAAHDDPEALVLVPLAFLALHLAYGSGFLAGIRTWRRISRSTSR